MNLNKLWLIIPLCAFVTSCNSNNNVEKRTLYLNENNNFRIINFADTQFDEPDSLNEGSMLYKLITKSVEEAKPDMITFSGDNAWHGKTRKCYKTLCDFMDNFKVPYFLTFGNHDLENATASGLISVVQNSKYGYMEKGPSGVHGKSNYVVDIKNKNNEIVHSVFMMDSGSGYKNKTSLIKYVDNPVDGFIYLEHNNKKYYGSTGYDNVRDKQIDWYEKETKKRNNESSIIMHIPCIQYAYAYEDYLLAIKNNDSEKLNELSPVGKCRMYEACCSSSTDFGFFDKITELGKTKNVISGHDHNDDYSIIYNGVRLTYSLKTGDGCYWISDGSMCGYTALDIDESGHATLTQNYINPLN